MEKFSMFTITRYCCPAFVGFICNENVNVIGVIKVSEKIERKARILYISNLSSD